MKQFKIYLFLLFAFNLSNCFGQNNDLNIAKFALSVCSIFFDIIFLIQHFCLYKKKDNYSNLYVQASPDSQEILTISKISD